MRAAVGAKMWCLFIFVTLRVRSTVRSRGAKFGLFAPIHVKLGRADGLVRPLGCAKFHLNRHMGWECGPKKYEKFPLFW